MKSLFLILFILCNSTVSNIFAQSEDIYNVTLRKPDTQAVYDTVVTFDYIGKQISFYEQEKYRPYFVGFNYPNLHREFNGKDLIKFSNDSIRINIKIAPFDSVYFIKKVKADSAYFYKKGYFGALNPRIYLGKFITSPDYQIIDFTIEINGKKSLIPKKGYEFIFDPNKGCYEPYCNMKAYISNSGEIILRIHNEERPVNNAFLFFDKSGVLINKSFVSSLF